MDSLQKNLSRLVKPEDDTKKYLKYAAITVAGGICLYALVSVLDSDGSGRTKVYQTVQTYSTGAPPLTESDVAKYQKQHAQNSAFIKSKGGWSKVGPVDQSRINKNKALANGALSYFDPVKKLTVSLDTNGNGYLDQYDDF